MIVSHVRFTAHCISALLMELQANSVGVKQERGIDVYARERYSLVINKLSATLSNTFALIRPLPREEVQSVESSKVLSVPMAMPRNLRRS